IVIHAVEDADLRRVDVAADHSRTATLHGVPRDDLLEVADKARGLLNPPLDRLTERPVAETEAAAEAVEDDIEPQEEVVAGVSQARQPAGMQDAGVELVAVHDEHFSAVGGYVDELVGQLHASQVADEIAQKLVVIPGGVTDLGPALHHVDDALEQKGA